MTAANMITTCFLNIIVADMLYNSLVHLYLNKYLPSSKLQKCPFKWYLIVGSVKYSAKTLSKYLKFILPVNETLL